ncbi:MAG: alpha/beta fold hydrolase [Deltaproteobacteria bacterium]|nr:alpha/beta fold hydrolase [Deltaproteobacteria bacterium]
MTRASRTLSHRGCELHYEVSGEGTPVVFIQGMGLHGRGWAPQIDALEARFRCLSFDNRGMARSQPVAETLTIPLMAADVIALMDREGLTKAHLVGHSMGGLIALATALEHRARVLSLSLLNTFARGSDASRPRGPMIWIGARTMIGTRRMKRLAFLEMVMPAHALEGRDRDALAKELEPIFGHDLGERPPIVMSQLSATGAYDATPRLGELATIRTLVVSATHDVVAPPAFGRAMAQAIPNARYVEIADAAHGWPIQKVDECNSMLAEHFAG